MPQAGVRCPPCELHGPESAAVKHSGCRERCGKGMSQPLLLQRHLQGDSRISQQLLPGCRSRGAVEAQTSPTPAKKRLTLSQSHREDCREQQPLLPPKQVPTASHSSSCRPPAALSSSLDVQIQPLRRQNKSQYIHCRSGYF